MEKIKIITECGYIEFVLEYKKIKNMYLRINKEGEPQVTASKRFSKQDAAAFVRTKAHWIIKAAEKAKKHTLPRTGYYILGSFIPFAENQRNLSVGEQKLFIKKRTKRAAKKLLPQIFEKYIQKYSSSFGVNSELKFRDMKTRYGSCDYRRRIITLAYMLANFPEPLIEYVIAHELCHLRVPNHSREFYKILEKIMPDYKVRRKELKRQSEYCTYIR